VVNARPGRLTPRKDPVPFVQEVVWETGTVWKDTEDLASNGIRSPDRLARHESQDQLSYLTHQQ